MCWVGISWGTGSNTSEYQSASKLARLQIWQGNCRRNRCHVHQMRVSMTQYDSVSSWMNTGTKEVADVWITKLSDSKWKTRPGTSKFAINPCPGLVSNPTNRRQEMLPEDTVAKDETNTVWGLLGIFLHANAVLLSRVRWHCKVSHLSTYVTLHQLEIFVVYLVSASSSPCQTLLSW